MTTTITRMVAWSACVVCLLGVSAASAADYYIDDANGADAHDGTTETTAWKTLARIGQAPLQPGDRVLLKRGGLWKEALPVPASGARDKPITYAAYGAGNQPQIVAEKYAVDIARKSGITLQDLDIIGNGYAVFIHARQGEYSGFIFRNCRITCLGAHGLSGHCIHQASEPIITERNGRRVADEGPAVFKNLVVVGCILTPGRQGWSNGINLHNNVTDFTIENNVIGPAGEDAILLWNCKSGIVASNTCGGNGENSIDIKNSSDLMVSHNSCTNDNYGGILLHEIMFLEEHKPNDLNQRVVIEHNTITGAGQCFRSIRSAPEITAGIWMNNSDDCIVRYNRLVDCLGSGIQIDDAESSQNNNQVYGNVIVNAGQFDWCAGIDLADCVGTRVFNNLIYNQQAGAGISLRGGKNAQGIQVLNNIVTTAPFTPDARPSVGPPLLVRLRPEAGRDLVCDYNCYGPDRDDGLGGSLPGKVTLARGRLRDWQDAFQLDLHSFAADPKLKSPASGDFTLTLGSPCVGKATRIGGYARDAAGTAIPQGPAPDIGPYEMPAIAQ